VTERGWSVGLGDAGARLDKFLSDSSRIGSRKRSSEALARGRVFVNDVEASRHDAGRRLEPGDRVKVWTDRPGTARRGRGRTLRAGQAEIVFDDGVVIVVNKPSGLLTVPLDRRASAPSVQDQLLEYLRARGKRKALVVHRIDRDTSGLVAFVTDRSAQHALRDQFKRHEPERVYLAVVCGHPAPESGAWRDRLVWDDRAVIQREAHPRNPHGKTAESEYRVLERFPAASLIEVRLVTGKRNQIRLQAQLRGHALVGEQRYVNGPESFEPITFSRQALHAYRLGFDHPVSGERLCFEAPLPPDMAELLATLRRRGGRDESFRRPRTSKQG
jgi:23S rRNA pseudouridine1911/1915/1917 synthase